MSDNDKEYIAGGEGDDLDPEGDEILELLNGDPDGNEGDEDEMGDELEPQDGDSPEVLKTKLAAKNHIIRKREKAIKRMQQELEAKQSGGVTAEDLAKILQSKGDEGEQNKAPTIEELKEQFDEDPSSVVDLIFQANQQLEQKLANVLKQRDEHFTKKFAPDGGQVPAEVMQLAERLKSRPEYAEFNEEQLLTVAKTLKPLKKRVGRVPSSVTSGNLPLTASNADVEKVSKSALEAMGYSDEN